MKWYLIVSLACSGSYNMYSSITTNEKQPVINQALAYAAQETSSHSTTPQTTTSQRPPDGLIIKMAEEGYTYDTENNRFEFQESSFSFLARFLSYVPQLISYVCADSDLMGSFESSSESAQAEPEKEKQD